MGMLRIDLNATVLAVVLVLEVIAVLLFDIGAFAHPAEGAAVAAAAAWSPSALFVPGVGAVFALGVSAFTGFEQGAIYGEEVRNPRVTVARATFVTLAIAVVLFAVSSWAMLITVGPSNIQQTATELGPGLVFSTLEQHWGSTVATVANLLFFTGIFASLVSFHNGIARYFFALGRERVLPARMSRVGRLSGGPIAGRCCRQVSRPSWSGCSRSSGPIRSCRCTRGSRRLGRRDPGADGGHVDRDHRVLPEAADACLDLARRWRRRWPRSVCWRCWPWSSATSSPGHRAHLAAALGAARVSAPGGGRGVIRAQRMRSADPQAYAAIGTVGKSIGGDDEDDGTNPVGLPRSPNHRA